MIITKQDTGRYASSILDFLEKQNIDTLQDLDKVVGKEFPVRGSDKILVSEGPSGCLLNPSRAKTITYLHPKGGFPIEIRINADNGFSKIYVKCNNYIIKGYNSIAKDNFDNTLWEKQLRDIRITRIKEELEYLIQQTILGIHFS